METVIPGWPLAIVLFIIGLYGCITQRNILKTIISVNIMGLAAIILIISTNFHTENTPPIVVALEDSRVIADPVPQALMITAIVIGIAVTAVSLALLIRVVRRYGTADWKIIINRLNR